MKKLIFILFIGSTIILNAQTSFDAGLSKLVTEIGLKISEKNDTMLAVWDFSTVDGEINNLGKYVAENVSVKLSNTGKEFYLMDRNHLTTILKEHKLNSEGLIDQNTAKELGRLTAVDAIVTGTITILNEKIQLTIKVLDTETAMIVASTMGFLPLDDDIKALLGVQIDVTNTKPSGSEYNTGYKRPQNSNESYTPNAILDKDCNAKNTGDLSFTNIGYQVPTSVKLYYIDSNEVRGKEISIEVASSETKCFYNLKVGKYYMRFWNTQVSTFGEGYIMVEECKSKNYNITKTK